MALHKYEETPRLGMIELETLIIRMNILLEADGVDLIAAKECAKELLNTMTEVRKRHQRIRDLAWILANKID